MRRTSVVVAALLLGAAPAQAASVTIEGAWIREAPPGATVLGGYMTLRNPGSRADRLLRVQTPAAGKVEIHEMAVQDGVMSMRPLSSLALPAGATVVLKPRGTHMMLMDLKRPLRAGARVPMTFVFERAGTVRRVVPVQRGD